MKRSSQSIVFAVFLICVSGGPRAIASPDDSLGMSNAAVVRLQLQDIANEIVDSLKFETAKRVAVLVEGEGPRTLTENAFIEALQKQKYSLVGVDTGSTSQILHVFIFNPEIKIRELDGKSSVRNIRTSLEARVDRGGEQGVHILGLFRREAKDTAQVFAAMLTDSQKNTDAGIFQRMLTPFVVLGGAIVIVYLFFTVRS